MYGLTAIFFPVIILINYKRKHVIPLLLIMTLFFLLGLGGTTILPQIMFGDAWEWLTYERFTLWASLLLLPFVGSIISRIKSGKHGKMLFYFLFTAFIVSSIYIDSSSYVFRLNHTYIPINVVEVTDYVNTQENQRWRYLTLGFGEPAVVKLSILTNQKTLDGHYSTARSLPILTTSGIHMLDSAKLYQKGLLVLEQVLEDTSMYNIKWIFSNDRIYDSLLENAGFLQLHILNSGIEVWEKENVQGMYFDNRSINFIDYYWGVVPMLPLMMLQIITFKPYLWSFRKIKLHFN
jgi:hypothetical protein